jgi:hypothetical protein
MHSSSSDWFINACQCQTKPAKMQPAAHEAKSRVDSVEGCPYSSCLWLGLRLLIRPNLQLLMLHSYQQRSTESTRRVPSQNAAFFRTTLDAPSRRSRSSAGVRALARPLLRLRVHIPQSSSQAVKQYSGHNYPR